MDQPAASETGFTLVEVLVALVVLAIAAAGLIGAAEAHVDALRSMQSRAAAQWVAENRIAELTAGSKAASQTYDLADMLGQTYAVTVTRRSSEDPDLDAMTVAVAEVETSTPLVTMQFFLARQRDPVP